MHPSAREAYISSQINAAASPKLHLMLLDGAIRFGASAKKVWTDDPLRDEALTRCRKIAGELLSSVRTSESDISKQLADIYQFIYLTVVQSQINAEESKLDEALRILEEQRETWRQVCDKFGSETKEADIPGRAAAMDSGLSPSATPSIVAPPLTGPLASPADRISFEA